MIGQIQQADARQSPGAQRAQLTDMLAALDQIVPQFALQHPRSLNRPGGGVRHRGHLGLPVPALIRLLFPVVKKGLFMAIQAHFRGVFLHGMGYCI